MHDMGSNVRSVFHSGLQNCKNRGRGERTLTEMEDREEIMSENTTMTEREEFISIFRDNIHRDGAEDLLNWLETSDFFDAPASTKYHLSEPGGLCRHTLHVYKRLKQLTERMMPEQAEPAYTGESIAIVALLHDICKVNFYEQSWKNQKTYDKDRVAAADPWKIKRDNAGDFIWESVPCYTVNEKLILGHGEKSAMIAMYFMKLSMTEAQAIRYHMGPWNEGEAKDAGNCFEQNTLAFLLHTADEFATFIDEVTT